MNEEMRGERLFRLSEDVIVAGAAKLNIP